MSRSHGSKCLQEPSRQEMGMRRAERGRGMAATLKAALRPGQPEGPIQNQTRHPWRGKEDLGHEAGT